MPCDFFLLSSISEPHVVVCGLVTLIFPFVLGIPGAFLLQYIAYVAQQQTSFVFTRRKCWRQWKFICFSSVMRKARVTSSCGIATAVASTPVAPGAGHLHTGVTLTVDCNLHFCGIQTHVIFTAMWRFFGVLSWSKPPCNDVGPASSCTWSGLVHWQGVLPLPPPHLPT